MEEYHLFPDIRLVCGAGKTPACSGIVITYSLDGMREYRIDGKYFYLTAGSCIVLRGDDIVTADTADFRAVTIIIDDKNVPESTDGMLFDSRSFTDKLSTYTPYITKAGSEIARLFSEAEKFCGASDTVMLRIRAVEALMLISNGLSEVPADKMKKTMASAELICGDIAAHYTIPQLAQNSQLNPTTFKETFRLTFGCSVYSYAKCRKMFRAAELLLNTDMKIIDIAAEVGYCNASKFAKAFCDVMGRSPRHFRMEHTKRLNVKIPCAAASATY